MRKKALLIAVAVVASMAALGSFGAVFAAQYWGDRLHNFLISFCRDMHEKSKFEYTGGEAFGVRKLACAFHNINIINHLKAAASCRTARCPSGANRFYYPDIQVSRQSSMRRGAPKRMKTGFADAHLGEVMV